MIGRLTIGSIGFGWLAVIGRSLVPSPPAITTAFTYPTLPDRHAAARPPARRSAGAWPAPGTAGPHTSTVHFPRWPWPNRRPGTPRRGFRGGCRGTASGTRTAG